jgi:hypothetical protein
LYLLLAPPILFNDFLVHDFFQPLLCIPLERLSIELLIERVCLALHCVQPVSLEVCLLRDKENLLVQSITNFSQECKVSLLMVKKRNAFLGNGYQLTQFARVPNWLQVCALQVLFFGKGQMFLDTLPRGLSQLAHGLQVRC